MMFLYTGRYPVNEKLDPMDSAMRIGIISTFNVKKIYDEGLASPNEYINHCGICFRLPLSGCMPASNQWNFTRDQMMCLLAGIRAYYDEMGYPLFLAKKVFIACLKRGFFAQNFERDMPGSTKYPWPHSFYKDSNRDLDIQHKWFDWADPLWPSHISHLITCGKIRVLYPFHLIGWPMLLLQIIFNSRKLESEQNQLQCMIKTAGPIFVYFYKKFNPNWKNQTYHYWESRNEKEYAEWIVKGLES